MCGRTCSAFQHAGLRTSRAGSQVTEPRRRAERLPARCGEGGEAPSTRAVRRSWRGVKLSVMGPPVCSGGREQERVSLSADLNR
jgi:hypothetical protein